MKLARYLVTKKRHHLTHGIILASREQEQQRIEKRRDHRLSFFTFFLISIPLSVISSSLLVLGLISHAYETTRINIEVVEQIGDQSSFIYDSSGQELYEFFGEKRRYLVSLDQISPHMINAVTAAEDKNFYTHDGVDVEAIARSGFINVSQNDVSTGASTITQQVIKHYFFADQGLTQAEKSLERKADEALLAIRLEETYTKNQIMEKYLNDIFLGNQAWGVEAAAQIYFAKPASQLTIAESAMIAGIISQPSRNNPHSGAMVPVAETDQIPERFYTIDATGVAEVPLYKKKQAYVLSRMLEDGHITSQQFTAAIDTDLYFQPIEHKLLYPHWVWFVEDYLVQRYGEERVRTGGLRIHTTLNPHVQDTAQNMVRAHVDRNRYLRNMSNASLVSLDPTTGHIIAMVGGYDFYDEAHDGEVNVVTSYRQPGSTMKPFIFAAALEQGYGASTILVDNQTIFRGGYEPKNFDLSYHGSTTFRSALANSYNIPPVKLLNRIGMPAAVDYADRSGLNEYEDPWSYGLSFALGGYEVRPLDLATAYGVLANEGRKTMPTPILYITDAQGNIIEDNRGGMPQEQVTDPGVAYIVSDILSDRNARVPAFGSRNSLNFSRQVAAKTGTTNNMKDNWTVAYVPGLVTVVWAGNNNGDPLWNSLGSSGAAPLVNQYMEFAFGALGKPASWYSRPVSVSYNGQDYYLNTYYRGQVTIR